MTVEQYKQLKKNQKEKRAEMASLHLKAQIKLIETAKEINNKEMLWSALNWTLENKRIKLPRNSFTFNVREAFEELILNDVSAIEGSHSNTSSMEDVKELATEMEEVTGVNPTSYCYLTRQDLSDFKKGSFYLGWDGDIDLIKSILEKNGLRVTYKDDRTKLLVEEKLI